MVKGVNGVSYKMKGISRLVDAGIIAILISLVFVTLYPLYYVFIVSISDGSAVQRGLVTFWPVGVQFDTYAEVFRDPAIVGAYWNTIVYTITGTAVNIVFTILCAYPLSRRQFYGRRFFTIMIVITMFFGGGLIPLYLVVMNLGLVNSMWALILPSAISAWNMIIMRTFFQGLPGELFDSAYIDGAGEWKILIRMVLPLSMPVISTMIIFYAVGHWNSFFPALIYLNEKSKYPVQLILRNIVISGEMAEHAAQYKGPGSNVIAQNIKYAVIIIVITPILMIYPFMQKYFIRGVLVGSLKG